MGVNWQRELQKKIIISEFIHDMSYEAQTRTFLVDLPTILLN